MEGSLKKVAYRDVWIVLAAVPLINVLNYYLTYSSPTWGSFLFITFTIDTFEGYCAWFAMRRLVIYLDGRYPWERSVRNRLLLQTPLVCSLGLVIIAGLTELINGIFGDKPIPKSFYTEVIFIFLIWALFVNFYYFGLYFLRRYQETKSSSANETMEKEALLIKVARSQKLIPISDFRMFHVSNELVYGWGPDGKTVLPGYTLNALENQLDTKRFFRLNRQSIVSHAMVREVKSDVNGKLAVTVMAEDDINPLIVSRLRAAQFRKWLESVAL